MASLSEHLSAWIPLLISIWFYIFMVRFISKLLESQEQQNKILEDRFNEELELVQKLKSISEVIGKEK